MPKVSVIVPVYKVENTLERCVESICAQTLQDIEIILVDDGSPDKCPELCEAFAKKDSRIKVIHKANAGLGYARNTGLDAATGEYVGFVDSDDYICANMYEDLYRAAEALSADAVYGGIYYVRDDKVTGKSAFAEQMSIWEGKEEIKAFLMDLISSDADSAEDSKYGATVWKAVFSRTVIENSMIRFYSERDYVSEDGLFDIDFLTKAQKVVMLPGNYYYYMYNPNSLTSVYRADRFEKNKALYNLGARKLWDAYGDRTQIVQYGRMFIAASRVCIIQEVFHAKNIGIRGALREICCICRDETLRKVLREYPWQRLPFKKRVFAHFMQKNCPVLQFLIVRLMYLKKNS